MGDSFKGKRLSAPYIAASRYRHSGRDLSNLEYWHQVSQMKLFYKHIGKDFDSICAESGLPCDA